MRRLPQPSHVFHSQTRTARGSQLPRINLPEGDIDAAFCKTAGFIKGAGAGFGNTVEGLAVGAAEDDEVAGEQGDVIPRFIAVLSTTDAEDCFITDGQRHNRSERSFISILRSEERRVGKEGRDRRLRAQYRRNVE